MVIILSKYFPDNLVVLLSNLYNAVSPYFSKRQLKQHSTIIVEHSVKHVSVRLTCRLRPPSFSIFPRDPLLVLLGAITIPAAAAAAVASGPK